MSSCNALGKKSSINIFIMKKTTNNYMKVILELSVEK
jgi:hypothetical protein